MIRVICEECDQRVGVAGPPNGDGRRRVAPHKSTVLKGRMWVIDKCPGKFERRERDR